MSAIDQAYIDKRRKDVSEQLAQHRARVVKYTSLMHACSGALDVLAQMENELKKAPEKPAEEAPAEAPAAAEDETK